MKLIGCIVVGLGIVALASYDSSSAVGQENLVGKHYWRFSEIDNSDELTIGLLELNIVEVGDGHFLCSGMFRISAPFLIEFSTFGNVVCTETETRITLSVQGKRFDDHGNYTVGIDMDTLTLDPDTLNGTSEGAGVYIDEVELSEHAYTYLGNELPVDSNSWHP